MKVSRLLLGQLANTALVLCILPRLNFHSDCLNRPLVDSGQKGNNEKSQRFNHLRPLPACATKADLKWQPALDFDKDCSYNTLAIDATGALNPGSGPYDDPFPYPRRRHIDLVMQNVYARTRCNNDWCAHAYAYYFPLDVGNVFPQMCTVGHRHDWEHVVVWTHNDTVKEISISVDRDFITAPPSWLQWTEDGDGGKHVRVVYHKIYESMRTFRFATEADEEAENDTGEWFRGPLVSWDGFGDERIRDAMVTASWGEEGPELRDGQFEKLLERAMSFWHVPLDVTYDDEDALGQTNC